MIFSQKRGISVFKSRLCSSSVAALAVCGLRVSLTPAQVSAAATVGVSKTEKLADLEVVTISLAGIPAGQGVY
ncbi:MAG: hypothetical protein ACKOQX_04370, partial [Actinomycetota bacterium]